MKKALVIVFTNLKYDGRVSRQIKSLKKKFAVTACSYGGDSNADYRIISIKNKLTFKQKAISGILLLLRQYSAAHRVLYPYLDFLKKELHGEHFDLIVANDVETLPIAFHFKGADTRVIFDAHEYAPRHFEDKLAWRIFFQRFNTHLCRKYIPRTDAMLTISKTLADEYEKEFGKKPTVIINSGPYREMKPRETSEQRVRLVHHGTVGPSRRIELIIAMMKTLPAHFTLDLILMMTTQASSSSLAYLQGLKDLAAGDGRIRFLDPVSSDKIVGVLHDYDMGIILAPPINFNYRSGIPNKLFDYIQARIAVVTGPTQEIARIVQEAKIGVVADGFSPEQMAASIAGLDRVRLQEFKRHTDMIAKEMNAEKNEEIFHVLLDRLF